MLRALPKPAWLEKENRSPSMKPSAQEKKQRGRGCRRTSCLKGRAFPRRSGDVGRNMVREQRRASSDRGEPRRHLSMLGTRGGHGDRGPGSQQHHKDLVDFQSPSPSRCCPPPPPPNALAPLRMGFAAPRLCHTRHGAGLRGFFLGAFCTPKMPRQQQTGSDYRLME